LIEHRSAIGLIVLNVINIDSARVPGVARYHGGRDRVLVMDLGRYHLELLELGDTRVSPCIQQSGESQVQLQGLTNATLCQY